VVDGAAERPSRRGGSDGKPSLYPLENAAVRAYLRIVAIRVNTRADPLVEAGARGRQWMVMLPGP
jgi:hypothetical protein